MTILTDGTVLIEAQDVGFLVELAAAIQPTKDESDSASDAIAL